MKKLPQVNVSFENLYRMLIAPIRSKLLLAGIELKVFNELSESKSAKAVAKAIGAHPENTRLFLDGLTAGGFVLKKNALYWNTPQTEAFLVEGEPTYLGGFFKAQSQWMEKAMEDMAELIIKGAPPPSGKSIDDEKVWAEMTALTANYQRAGMGQQIARLVSNLPEFISFKKMLDLGGGAGLIGIAITAEHPNMVGIIYDRPEVLKVAKHFIKEYEMEERVKIMAGDYHSDSIGEGYDLIWSSATLNFAKHNIDHVLKKIYDALNQGGVFMNFNDGLTHERTKPETMVLALLPTAVMGNDFALDQGFIVDSMLRVGFKSVRSRTLDTLIGPMDLDIGRKE
jgi:predicted O-methyltransferase YrrM